MFLCWSAKGGCGTTVVAASLALVLARDHPVLLVDLAGDVPAALGLDEPAGPGLSDWLASPTASAASLGTLAVQVTGSLQVLPWGAGPADPVGPVGPQPAARWRALADALSAHHRSSRSVVVVDAGHHAPPDALAVAAQHRLLVMRSCYLTLRRTAPHRGSPTGIVLVKEAGRALGARDIEHAVGAPVVAEVAWDPAVFRAVDAGLLASRLPASITRSLGRLADESPSVRGAA